MAWDARASRIAPLSKDGTFLERELKVTRITSPQPLLAHDVIRVGSIRLVFDLDLGADIPPVTPSASKPDTPPLVPEEPDAATEVLGETRVGRCLPVFLEPPEASAPTPHLARLLHQLHNTSVISCQNGH